MPLGMVFSHVLNCNFIIVPLRFVQGLFLIVLGRRPQMSPDSSTIMSPLKGNMFMSLVISGLRWRQCSEARAVLLYIFMIDATYLYHKDFDSPLVSPYSYVPF